MSWLKALLMVAALLVAFETPQAFAGRRHGCGCKRVRHGGVSVRVGVRPRVRVNIGAHGYYGGRVGVRVGGYGYGRPYGFHPGFGRFPRRYFRAPIRNALFGFRPNRITPVRQFLFGRGRARRVFFGRNLV